MRLRPLPRFHFKRPAECPRLCPMVVGRALTTPIVPTLIRIQRLSTWSIDQFHVLDNLFFFLIGRFCYVDKRT